MRNKLLAAGLPVLLLSASMPAASAFEIQADQIRSEDGRTYLYRDNVEIRFDPEEHFEISADEITEQDGVARYSGNVRIAFKTMQLQTDDVRVSRTPDGSHVMSSRTADLVVGEP